MVTSFYLLRLLLLFVFLLILLFFLPRHLLFAFCLFPFGFSQEHLCLKPFSFWEKPKGRRQKTEDKRQKEDGEEEEDEDEDDEDDEEEQEAGEQFGMKLIIHP